MINLQGIHSDSNWNKTPLVSVVSAELYTLLEKVSEKHKCIWPVTPRDLVDTLADQCNEVLLEFNSLTNVHRPLLDFFSKEASLAELSECEERQEKLRSLKLFPTAKGSLVSLRESAYVSQDFTFPPVGFDTILLDDGPSHKWRRLYLLLGVPELSRSRLIRNVLLSGFEALDEIGRVNASEWLRDNLSLARTEDENEESGDLLDVVLEAHIIVCEDGVLRAPTIVYQPESRLAYAVLGSQANFPDMRRTYAQSRERWLEFFRQLHMPDEPRLPDVVDYVRSQVTGDRGEVNAERLQVVYDYVKRRVDTEVQDLHEISEELTIALRELAQIPWVPVRQEPGDFLAFRHPDEICARPCDVYFPRVGQLVASQASIAALRPEPGRRVREAMEFPVTIPVELVVKHFQEVLGACRNSEKMPKATLLNSALGQIYRYFGGKAPKFADDLDEDSVEWNTYGATDLKTVFSEIPCIWDPEMERFWRPDHVFTENVRYMEPWRRTIRIADDAIERGYAALGRKREPTIEDWKKVLVEIEESHISPTEKVSAVIQEVVRHIVDELTKADEFDGEVLVPTRDGRLLKAETVFLADAPWFESKLDSWGIPVLSTSVSGLRGIQHVFKISSLADAVEERIREYPSESVLENERQECARLEDLLRSRELILGLQRLLRHEEQQVSYESLSFLSVMEVRCVKVIRTCLYLQTDGAERFLGDDEADFYWDSEAIQGMLVENRLRYFCDDLAELLNRILEDRCLRNLAPLVHLLRSEPKEISKVLDDLKVRQYTFDREVRSEDEDEIAPQIFPDEVEVGGEMHGIVESNEPRFRSIDDEYCSEPEESPESGREDHRRDGSTATRPRQDGSNRSGRGTSHDGSSGDRGSIVPSNPSATEVGSTNARSDIERIEPSSTGSGSSRESTAGRHQPTVQRRLVSYVSQSPNDGDSEDTSVRSDGLRLRIGDAAVKIVIEHEHRMGRKARSMAHPNAGYDVVSEDEGNTRYIEVKGTEAAWGERGVAMTPMQFFYGRENPGRDHWLYVVENVFSETPQIHEIQAPSEMVDRFMFDGGWRQVAERTEGSRFEMPIPKAGDEVMEDDQVIGIVESTLAAGRFPLVIYRDLAGKQQRKLLAELTVRTRES